MAIAYRSGSSVAGATATSIVIDKPAGAVDGDILVINLYKEVSSAWTPPAGWTQICDLTNGDGGPIYMTAYWKRAASEGTTYTFTVASTWIQATMTAWSGCLASGDVINTSATNTCTGGIAAHTPVAASITTTVANTMRVVAMIDNNGTNVTAGTSGMSQAAESGGDEFFYLAQAAAGASGTATFSAIGDYEHWITVHFALLAEAGGTVVSDGNSTSKCDEIRLGAIQAAPVLSYVGKSAAAAGGTTALSITYPAGIKLNDYCVIAITNKYPAAATPATPSGWGTIAGTRSVGGFGVGGVDSGTVQMSLFLRSAVGTESSGTVAVTISSGNAAIGAMTVYRSNTGSVNAYGGTAKDTTAGTAWTGTANSTITAAPHDYYLVAAAINTDGVTFSAQTVAQTSITFGTVTERWDTGTTSGNDCGIMVSDHVISSGTASSAPTFAMTASTSGTAIPTGAMVFLLLNPVGIPDVIPFDHGVSTSTGDAFAFGGAGPDTIAMSEGTSTSTGDAVITKGIYPLVMSEGRALTEGNPITTRGIYPLIMAEGASTSTSDPAVLIGLYNLAVSEGASTSTSDAFAMSASAAITVSDGTSTSTGDAFVTAGIYSLVASEGASTSTIDAIIVTPVGSTPTITVSEGSSASTGDPFITRGIYGLVASEGVSTSAGDAVTIAGLYGVTVSEGASTSTADAFVTRGLYPLVWSEGASTSTGDPFVTLAILRMVMSEGMSATTGDLFALTIIADFMGLGNRRGYPVYDNGSSLASGDGARAGLRTTSSASGDGARSAVRTAIDAGEDL